MLRRNSLAASEFYRARAIVRFMLSCRPSLECFLRINALRTGFSQMQSCWRILDVMGVLSLGVAKLLQMRVMQPCIFICNVPSRPIGVVGRYKRDRLHSVSSQTQIKSRGWSFNIRS